MISNCSLRTILTNFQLQQNASDKYEQQLFRILVVTELCSYSNPFKFRYACGDGYLKVYTKGQEEKYHYDKHDYEFCGTATPPVVKTEGPRLVLLFKVRNIFGFFLKRMHIR